MAKRVLGRGLDALLSDNTTPEVIASGERVVDVAVSSITPNPNQPRKSIPEGKLRELSESIREKGLLQPILLRPTPAGGYEIVAGERRFRAAKMLGWTTIPAVVRAIPDAQLMEIALVENIQREDLDEIELASALDQLITSFGYTHQDLAKRLGKDRSSISNTLRLLKLAPRVREALSGDSITAGHARALAGLESHEAQESWCLRVERDGLSVRALEGLLASTPARRTAKPRGRKPNRVDPSVASFTEKLQQALGTRVHIRHRGKAGRIEIEYYSLDELERLLDMLLAAGRER